MANATFLEEEVLKHIRENYRTKFDTNSLARNINNNSESDPEGLLDLVLDDASHMVSVQIPPIKNLLPYLNKQRGVYLVEDVWRLGSIMGQGGPNTVDVPRWTIDNATTETCGEIELSDESDEDNDDDAYVRSKEVDPLKIRRMDISRTEVSDEIQGLNMTDLERTISIEEGSLNFKRKLSKATLMGWVLLCLHKVKQIKNMLSFFHMESGPGQTTSIVVFRSKSNKVKLISDPNVPVYRFTNLTVTSSNKFNLTWLPYRISRIQTQLARQLSTSNYFDPLRNPHLESDNSPKFYVILEFNNNSTTTSNPNPNPKNFNPIRNHLWPLLSRVTDGKYGIILNVGGKRMVMGWAAHFSGLVGMSMIEDNSRIVIVFAFGRTLPRLGVSGDLIEDGLICVSRGLKKIGCDFEKGESC